MARRKKWSKDARLWQGQVMKAGSCRGKVTSLFDGTFAWTAWTGSREQRVLRGHGTAKRVTVAKHAAERVCRRLNTAGKR